MPPEAASIGVPSDSSEVAALRFEVKKLTLKIDQLCQSHPPEGQMIKAVQEIRAVAEALPAEVTEATGSALEIQRQAAVKVFDAIDRKILADIRQLQDASRQVPQAQAGQPVSVVDLDARFQWLVEAISERFVTLGNGLARIEGQLAAEHPLDRACHITAANGSNGAGASGTAAPRGDGSNGVTSKVRTGDTHRA